MSNNAVITENQQGSRCVNIKFLTVDPSETTRRAPLSRKIIKAYFLGALHDGTFSSNRRFRISQKGTAWLEFLKRLLKMIGYNSWIYREGKDRDIYVLETLAKFLDFKFDPISLKTQEEKIAYVRGFFDAEGGIPHKKKDRFYIQLVQSDKIKLRKIKKILQEAKIKTGRIHNPSKKRDPNHWRLYVLVDSHKSFIDIIGSWHPRKIDILRERMMI